MNELDRKIRELFHNEYVYKDDRTRAIFSGVNIPSFIKDWIVKKFFDEDSGEVDIESLKGFLSRYIPTKDQKLKGLLITHPGLKKKVITRIITSPDVASGEIRFAIPDLGITFGEGLVPIYLARKEPKLRGGEAWGVAELCYYKDEEQGGYIELASFTPFNPYEVNPEYYMEVRREFSLEEWIDLLIRAMEYNPEGFASFDQKLYFLLRLLVFVEPNLNIIELAPKGTGKSYVFGNLTKHGWLVSGGFLSRAKLFYDIAKNMEGLVTRYDFIALDEIQTIRFSDTDEIRGVLKSYLESGTFNVSNYRGEGQAGFVLLGNITLTYDRKPVNRLYFEELPSLFHESALIDRFHGFIEGWKLPRMNEFMKVRGYTLNVEFFSEVLHTFRQRGEYTAFIEDIVSMDRNADTRDKKAIFKITSAMLKVLFPDIALGKYPERREIEICLRIATSLRKTIKEQLHLLDEEFTPEVPIPTVK